MIDIQRFGPDFNNGSGFTATWSKPSFNPLWVEVYLCGSGGGGGSGAHYPLSTHGLGGGGGTGGELICVEYDAVQLPQTVTVVLGAGGIGGVAQTANDWGLIGSDGGASTFGTLTARGGLANAVRAVGGTNTSPTKTFPVSGNKPGGNTGTNTTYNADAVDVTYTAVGAGVYIAQSPLGGGSGGYGRHSLQFGAGGNGVPSDTWLGAAPPDNSGWISNATAGVPKDAVSLAPTLIPWYSGGGGAGGVWSGPGFTGGNGKFGSGAGGGSGTGGGTQSGAGGIGGHGFCVVISYG